LADPPTSAGEVGFSSQKHFIGLYILRRDAMNAHRDQHREGYHLLLQTRADRFSHGRKQAARHRGVDWTSLLEIPLSN
jgi:hypothetical protein